MDEAAGPDPAGAPFVHAQELGTRGVAGRTAGAAVLAVAGSGFDGCTAIVTSRVLGPEGRGEFAVTLAIVALVAVLACSGVTTAARVLLAPSSAGVSLGEYLASSPLHVLAGTAVGCIATGLFVVWVLDIGSWSLVGVGGLVTGGITMSSFVFDGLHALGRHRWATATNSTGSLVVLILSLALAAVGAKAVPLYLLALAASLAVQSVLGLMLLCRLSPSRVEYRGVAHRRLLRVGFPALPYLSATLITFRLDRYLVGSLAGIVDAGLYSVAATLSEASRSLPNALGQVLLFGRASGRISEHLERRARRVVIALVAFTLIVVGTAAYPIVRTLFGPEFTGAVAPLRILLIGEVLISIWLIDSRLLVGNGKMGAASITTVLSAALLILGDLVFVPRFGLNGAAAASLVAYAGAVTAAGLFLRRFGRSTKGSTGVEA